MEMMEQAVVPDHSDSSHDAVMTPAPPRTGPALMSMPVEIRENIFRHVFDYNRPLYTVRGGRLLIDREARRDMQCLRTCRAFYCEATPQIHAISSLEIHYDRCVLGMGVGSMAIAALARMPQGAEIYVGKVIIYCSKEAQMFAEGNPGHNMTDRISVEDTDFAMIAQACPNMNHLEIFTYHSCSLLWMMGKLLKSLPCSSIRDWPVLRVDVKVHDNVVSDDDNIDITGKQITYAVGHQGVPSLGTTWLRARSSFRLAHEIPNGLRSIRIQGVLSERLCQTLEKHRCSFGDCSFKKEENPQEPPLPCDVRYTWHKTGEVIPQDEEKAAQVMAAMNQWVPKLSPEEYVSLCLIPIAQSHHVVCHWH